MDSWMSDENAEKAEDVAAGFTTFRAPLPEHAAEVTSLIAALYAISSSLSDLEGLRDDERYRRGFKTIQSDLSLVNESLDYTLEDILDIFHDLDGGNTTPWHYKRAWVKLNNFFWNQAGHTLATRLAKYKTFLRELADITKE